MLWVSTACARYFADNLDMGEGGDPNCKMVNKTKCTSTKQKAKKSKEKRNEKDKTER